MDPTAAGEKEDTSVRVRRVHFASLEEEPNHCMNMEIDIEKSLQADIQRKSGVSVASKGLLVQPVEEEDEVEEGTKEELKDFAPALRGHLQAFKMSVHETLEEAGDGEEDTDVEEEVYESSWSEASMTLEEVRLGFEELAREAFPESEAARQRKSGVSVASKGLLVQPVEEEDEVEEGTKEELKDFAPALRGHLQLRAFKMSVHETLEEEEEEGSYHSEDTMTLEELQLGFEELAREADAEAKAARQRLTVTDWSCIPICNGCTIL